MKKQNELEISIDTIREALNEMEQKVSTSEAKLLSQDQRITMLDNDTMYKQTQEKYLEVF